MKTFDQEADEDMFIDLERATKIRRIALQELPANRKRKQSFEASKKKMRIRCEEMTASCIEIS